MSLSRRNTGFRFDYFFKTAGCRFRFGLEIPTPIKPLRSNRSGQSSNRALSYTLKKLNHFTLSSLLSPLLTRDGSEVRRDGGRQGEWERSEGERGESRTEGKMSSRWREEFMDSFQEEATVKGETEKKRRRRSKRGKKENFVKEDVDTG